MRQLAALIEGQDLEKMRDLAISPRRFVSEFKQGCQYMVIIPIIR